MLKMLPLLRKALWALALIPQARATLPPSQVVSMQVSQPKLAAYEPISKRNPITVSIANNVSTMYYLTTASVGTPPQSQTFILDTGSSDVWMFAPGACESSKTYELLHTCAGGSFNPNTSSTYQLEQAGEFEIQYGDGTEAEGDYFTDNLSIGGGTVKNLTMAVASVTDGQFFGIMGIGYRANEATTSNDIDYTGGSSEDDPSSGVDGDHVDGTSSTTPTLLDQMVSSGMIKAQAYSLWLDDLASSTGSILFGGVDHAKYSGEMITVPVEPEYGQHTEFQIEWSSMGLTDQSGSTLLGVNTSFPALALLDSGTPYITVPDDVFDQVEQYFALRIDNQWGPLVNCSLMPQVGTIDFGFGGPNGPVIAVPFSELALPLYEDETPLQFDDGSPVCQLAIQSSGEDYRRMPRRRETRRKAKAPSTDGDVGDDDSTSLEQYVLGAPFMRSAYLVFDVAHNQISLAQTNFHADGASNVTEISSTGAANAIPGVSKTVTENFTPPTPTGSYASSIDGSSYSDYLSSYYSRNSLGYTTTGGSSNYLGHAVAKPTSPSSFPHRQLPQDGKAPITTYASSLFNEPPGASTYSYTSRDSNTRSAIVGNPTPYGGPYGSTSLSYSPVTTSLGPVPTSRNQTSVSGVKTTYSQSAVTALESKPGRQAVVSQSSSGRVDAATATGKPGAAAPTNAAVAFAPHLRWSIVMVGMAFGILSF